MLSSPPSPWWRRTPRRAARHRSPTSRISEPATSGPLTEPAGLVTPRPRLLDVLRPGLTHPMVEAGAVELAVPAGPGLHPEPAGRPVLPPLQTDTSIRAASANRAVEGHAEAEHTAVARRQPVADLRGCRHADDRRGRERCPRSSRGRWRRRRRRCRRRRPPSSSRCRQRWPTWPRRAWTELDVPGRAVEGGVAEGEDAAVGGHLPVAATAGGGGDPHHRLVERVTPHGAVEGGVAEGEDARRRRPPPSSRGRRGWRRSPPPAGPEGDRPSSRSSRRRRRRRCRRRRPPTSSPWPSGVEAIPTIGSGQVDPGQGVVEGGVAEGEDSSVGRGEPVATPVGGGGDADRRRREPGTAGVAGQVGRDLAPAEVDGRGYPTCRRAVSAQPG